MEVKAQLFLIKTLWSELVEYQRHYEQDTRQLIENLKEYIETQIKSRILPGSSDGSNLNLNLNDSQTNISDLLAKKDQTIFNLLSELERLNDYVSSLQLKESITINNQNTDLILEENEQLKGFLSTKEMELLELAEKNKEYEGTVNFYKQQIESQAQVISELTEKNYELTQSLKHKSELMDELQKERLKNSSKDISTPFFKEGENQLSPGKVFQSIAESESFINPFEKEKKAGKNVKFNFSVEQNAKNEENHNNSIAKEEKKTQERNEKVQENEKKKFLDEIKRLKEKIYDLSIERENLIWSENNAIKQLHDFQQEKVIDLKKKAPEANKTTEEAKKFKKSQTMNLHDYNSNEKYEYEKKEEEKLILQLKEVLGELALL